ncbi:MAG: hypothetical protein ACRBEQ_11135 [Hyphomonas sp.]
MKIRAQILSGFCAFLFVACQTTDANLPTASGNFEQDIATALSLRDPYRADAALGQILDDPGLSDDQTARALYRRGSLRRQAGNDRLGAVADFEAMLALAPTHSLASNARTELSYTRQNVQQLQSQLRRLLTHAEWFDAMWVLGERDKAAARYQASRISPTTEQVKALTAAGYICKGDGVGPDVYQLGDRRSDLIGLKWCERL